MTIPEITPARRALRPGEIKMYQARYETEHAFSQGNYEGGGEICSTPEIAFANCEQKRALRIQTLIEWDETE